MVEIVVWFLYVELVMVFGNKWLAVSELFVGFYGIVVWCCIEDIVVDLEVCVLLVDIVEV